MLRKLMILATLIPLAGCYGGYGYTRAEVVYQDPPAYEYVVPVDRVVVVTREVLVNRGWVVYRVERSGGGRVIWARRGDDDMVRIFVTPNGNRVALRGLHERREEEREDEGRGHGHDRGKHRGWMHQGAPTEVLTDIDVRLRGR
jgi:hypothetical protein